MSNQVYLLCLSILFFAAFQVQAPPEPLRRSPRIAVQKLQEDVSHIKHALLQSLEEIMADLEPFDQQVRDPLLNHAQREIALLLYVNAMAIQRDVVRRAYVDIVAQEEEFLIWAWAHEHEVSPEIRGMIDSDRESLRLVLE